MNERTERQVREFKTGDDAFGKLLFCIKRDAQNGIDVREKYHRQWFYDPATQSLLKVSVNKRGGVSADITLGVRMLV